MHMVQMICMFFARLVNPAVLLGARVAVLSSVNAEEWTEHHSKQLSKSMSIKASLRQA